MEISSVAVISDTIDFANKYSCPPTGMVASCVDDSVCFSGRRIFTIFLSDFVDNLPLSFCNSFNSSWAANFSKHFAFLFFGV